MIYTSDVLARSVLSFCILDFKRKKKVGNKLSSEVDIDHSSEVMKSQTKKKYIKYILRKVHYNNLNCYINLNAHKVEMLSMSSLF